MSLNVGNTTPEVWAQSFSGPADISSDRNKWPAALVRHWTGTAPVMNQPPLDHHYIVQHLGGPKHVMRKGDGKPVSTAVDMGALTVVPVGSNFTWHTRGPIEFAHLYLSPALLESAAQRLDQAQHGSLIARVGWRDPLLENLFGAMLRELRGPGEANLLYLDCLLDTFVLRLLREHSTVRPQPCRARESLTAFRAARVLEYVEANIQREIALADLVGVAGGSVFHFSRAFKNTIGTTPYQFVLRRRVERAKLMLVTTALPIADIAKNCGFRDAVHLSRTFSNVLRTTPMRYRLDRP